MNIDQSVESMTLKIYSHSYSFFSVPPYFAGASYSLNPTGNQRSQESMDVAHIGWGLREW